MPQNTIGANPSTLKYVYLRLHLISKLIFNVAFSLAPIPAYLPQYLSIRKSSGAKKYMLTVKSSTIGTESQPEKGAQGFSPLTVFILLIAHIFRLTYFGGIWILQRRRKLNLGKILPNIKSPLKIDVISQSIVMIIIQLFLLHAMVSQRRTDRKRRLEEFGNSDSPTLSRFALNNFWKWDSFRVHLEFLLFVCVCCFAACLKILERYHLEGTSLFGKASVILESCLALPQFVLNYKTKSTAGLSFIMILGWVTGDSLKFVYFLLSSNGTHGLGKMSSENAMFVWGSVFAMFLDLSVFVQMLYIYPNDEVFKAKEGIVRFFTHGNKMKSLTRFFSRGNRHDSTTTMKVTI